MSIRDEGRLSLRRWADKYIDTVGRQERLHEKALTKDEKHLLWLANGIADLDKKMKRRDKELAKLKQQDIFS